MLLTQVPQPPKQLQSIQSFISIVQLTICVTRHKEISIRIDIAQVSHWIDKRKHGTLDPRELEQALNSLKQEREPVSVQRRLCLQTHTTDLESPMIGMAVVKDGVVSDAPDDAENWPYKMAPCRQPSRGLFSETIHNHDQQGLHSGFRRLNQY